MGKFGRKKTIIISGFCFAIGYFLSLFVSFEAAKSINYFNPTMLIIGRIFKGFGLGSNAACLGV